MRSAEASSLDGRSRLEELADRARPTALARERVLPVHDALLPLVPGGLVRGISVQIDGTRGTAGAGSMEGLGSTSLALALLAGPSAAGSWTAAVGVPTLGLAAAAGFGVDLGRLVLVAPPRAGEWGTVVATLLDAFDVVVARPPEPGRVRPADARRLAARARERGSVLVRLAGSSRWPEAADIGLTVTSTTWEGLGQGHGHLRARRAVVEASGRRGHDRPRRAELWLPGPGGVLAAAPPMAEVKAFPQGGGGVSLTAVRTLVLHVADWPVVAAGAAPEEPAAVVFANRVVAATPAARADGVAVGMRRRESQARCPELAVLDHDPGRDARAFEPVVATLAERIAPRIEVVTPGHLAFTTRGPSRYFGGDDALGRLVAELAGEVLGLRAVPHVGIADGPFAALLAARSAPHRVIPPLGSPPFLAPQLIDALALAGIDPELLDVLRRLGLRTLGAVAALDPGDVAGRFGSVGSAAHRLASGRDERPPATVAPSPDLAARAELDPPAERVETAAFVARGLADELARRLDGDGLACTRLLIAAETEHGERLERLWRGDGAGGASALTAGAIADRVRWQLEGWIGSGGTSAGIVLLELVPDEVVPAIGRQLGFWGGTAGADERAVRAVARVAGLLGLDAVWVPEWRGGRSPAEQVVLVPAAAVDLAADRPAARAPVAAGSSREGSAPWPGMLPAPAPASLTAPAVAVELVATDGTPVQVGGRGSLSAEPARVRLEAGWVDVVAWAGPWPVEERWWDAGRARRRARLQVLDATGIARLLAQEGGRWWLEAVYD